MSVPFKIIINNLYLKDLFPQTTLSPIDNKTILGLANGFEDGKWRQNSFLEFIWNNIAQTALSKKERESLVLEPFSSLFKSAKNLRITDNDKAGGEISEIFLYAILRHYYGAISAVPKIFYKQNVNDYAKGADSVHIVLDSEDDFSLWLGEAKFYNDISDVRLNEVVSSVHHTLETDKIKKENSIITNLNDIDLCDEISNELKNKIKNLLSGDTSIDEIKPKLHIPILLMYECDITKNETHYTNDYENKVVDFQKNRALSYFDKQIKKCSDIDLYSCIYFHLILFPVSEKNSIVRNFVEFAKNLRNE